MCFIYKDPVLRPLKDQKVEHETTIAESRSSPWTRFLVANQEGVMFIPSILTAVYTKSWMTLLAGTCMFFSSEKPRPLSTWIFCIKDGWCTIKAKCLQWTACKTDLVRGSSVQKWPGAV